MDGDTTMNDEVVMCDDSESEDDDSELDVDDEAPCHRWGYHKVDEKILSVSKYLDHENEEPNKMLVDVIEGLLTYGYGYGYG